MKTLKLYLHDPYLTEFDAQVIRTFPYEQKTGVVLDRTAFYPTSGGQMHDTGAINSIDVKEVIEEDDEIIHLLVAPLNVNAVRGTINWPRRFDFMQQHTGFHILAQSFLQVTGAETLSSHLGNEFSTIDVALDTIKFTQIAEVEDLANLIIFENRQVKAHFADPAKIDPGKIRKMPPELAQVRLVDIDNFDLDPCGGTHVRATGEVGLVKIIRWEKIRGYLRFEFYAGGRAIKDYQKKWQLSATLSNKFSASEDDLVTSVDKLQNEMKQLYKQNRKLTQKNIAYEAQELVRNAEHAGEKVITILFEDRELSDVRELAKQLTQIGDTWALLGLKGEKAHIIFAHSGKSDYNLNELVKQVAHLIDGRGGGRPNFVEIGGSKISALDEALQSARVIVENRILAS